LKKFSQVISEFPNYKAISEFLLQKKNTHSELLLGKKEKFKSEFLKSLQKSLNNNSGITLRVK
jgi:hypothetical protein